MSTIAVAVVCKVPEVGRSKTRLSPPLSFGECAALSACFIEDVARTIGGLAAGGGVTGCALYTPQGSEDALRRLLPDGFALILQDGDDLATRLVRGIDALLAAGHGGVVLVNADGPTLPQSILSAAVDAVRSGGSVALSPAHDGGYTLIGLSKPQPRLFEDIPWSTSAVHRVTLERAREIGLPVAAVPGWYDIDDEASLRMLEDELAGRPTPFTGGADAPASRRFLRSLRRA